MLPLVLFAAVSLLPWQPGTSIVSMTVSDLASGPGGWLMTVAFAFLGGVLILGSDRLLRWTGLGLVSVALWPAWLSLPLHALAAWPTFVLMAAFVYRANRPAGLLAALLVVTLIGNAQPIGVLERVLFALWLGPQVRTGFLSRPITTLGSQPK